MKKYLLLLGLLIATCSAALYAQEEVIVEPGAPGVLNQAIANPANQGKVFVLRRGFPYLLSGEIENAGFDLHIKAESGNGARPLLMFSPPPGGTSPDQLFSVRGNLTLESLHLTNVDLLGGYQERMIRTRVDDVRVIVDNCLMDDSGQTAFRLDGKNNKVYATNSIFSRMGRPSNIDNGRVLDDRGNLVDTIWIENCAIYNVTSRVIRDGGERIKFAYFNQNTTMNIAQRGFEWGPVDEFIFTNNIVVNGGFLGRRFSATPSRYQNDRHVINIEATAAGTGNWVVRNNNFFITADMVAATPFTRSDGDTVEQQPPFNPLLDSIIAAKGWTNTNIEEHLNFTNPPVLPIDFVNKHQNGNGGNAEPWDHSGIPTNELYSAIGSRVPRYSVSHDFGYSANSDSYTAGTERQPLGTTTLFEFRDLTSVKDLFVENNILYFPNPVREVLYIQNLQAETLAGIQVFNMQGQLVTTLRVNNDHVILDTSNWKNGMYILTVVDKRGNVSARKFVKN